MITLMRRYRRLLQIGLLLVIAAFVLTSVVVGSMSGGADRPDAGPDRIGGAERQHPHGQGEQREADEHGGDGDERRHQAGEAVRLLQIECPDDLEQAGKHEHYPSHCGPPSRKGRAVPAVMPMMGEDVASQTEDRPSGRGFKAPSQAGRAGAEPTIA